MYVLLIYREEADSDPEQRHIDHPFEGIEVIDVSVEEITLDDIEEIRKKLPNPANTKFHIDQI